MVGRLSEDEKAVIWNELEAGTSFRVIARKLGRQHTSIRGHVAVSGGVRPVLRCRTRGQLSAAEREEISRSLASSESMRAWGS